MEKINIRKNTQQPRFRGVKSIAVFQELFYWTTDDMVWQEEYHEGNQKYYHNVIYRSSVSEKPFICLHVFHPDSQPIPGESFPPIIFHI